NPYLLEGLDPDTTYDFYVQSICGGAGNSDWTGPFTFETEEELAMEDNTIAGFNFYPNPMDEILTLSAHTTLDKVIVYTVLGNQVINQNIGEATAEINVSSLTPGIYLMKVISNGKTGTYRLIKN
ncbi:MAG TPA: T9SS type A sorting domain-containing protein, partial [Flavobacteriaceae bacterium]|nr:T9SS type A sorting domain-containing protein [Flavobacteriaceae bacterium]